MRYLFTCLSLLILNSFLFAQDNENVGCMDVAALNYSAENDISEPSLCEYPTECLENQQLVMIDISIGNWSSEITWDIMDSGGTIVANSPSLNTFYTDYQIYTTYACLIINETYYFNSYDSYGDGWNDNGAYQLSICNGGVLIADNGDIPGYGETDEFIIDSENCDLYGCMDETACNYDGSALFSSSCIYPPIYYDCIGNCINDMNGNGICDELDVFGCTDSSVINFDEFATFDDGSCLYDLNCDNNQIQIDIIISTDSYPSETSFVLNDNEGLVWASEDECSIQIIQHTLFNIVYLLMVVIFLHYMIAMVMVFFLEAVFKYIMRKI